MERIGGVVVWNVGDNTTIERQGDVTCANLVDVVGVECPPWVQDVTTVMLAKEAM